MSSIFTQIINGEIPSHKVYEDDQCFAFLDIHPVNPGHVLLVPKVETPFIWDLDEATYAHVWQVARLLGKRIETAFHPTRVGVLVKGFDVPHAHIHIIPLYNNDDIKEQSDYSSEPDHDALARVASQIAS
jgi:histidine triad (HIT) family protein